MTDFEHGSAYYPLSLNINNRKCVVVGGGAVALRKVQMLLEFGAKIEVISEKFCPEIEQLKEKGMVSLVRRGYRQGDIEDTVLAIAATDDNDINQKISDEARDKGILINVVDDTPKSDFIVPSYLRRGNVTISVSTGGSSPALARNIREKLEKRFGADYAALAELISEVRAELKQKGVKVSPDEWQKALDVDSLIGMVHKGRSSEAKNILIDKLTKAGSGRRHRKSGSMRLCVLGVNHSKTPVEFREKLAISSGVLGDALASLRSYVKHGIILSTCNRTEIYTTSRDVHAAEQACLNFLKAQADVSGPDLLPYTYTYEDKRAVEYLFSVASGLESMIIGEFEILGQVGQALEAAEDAGMVDLPLRGLFRNAVRVGRRVRNETMISRNALSVSSVAVDLASKVVGDVSSCRVLVVGAGEAGKLVAKAARERGIRQISVISRTQERAAFLAAMLGGRTALLNDLKDEIGVSDIVVTCTGAPHLILDAPLVEEAMKNRPDLPLVVIDIAVPRDVDVAVENVDNVFLYNIDSLTEVSESNRELREREVGRASEIATLEADKFDAWWRSLDVKPTVTALVDKAEKIRQRQMDATAKKLKGLSDEERESLEAMTKSIVRKLLHEPIQLLKEGSNSDESYTQAVRELFGLEEENPG